MAQPHRKLSEAERDGRRRRDRERLAEAIRALLSADGWRAWLRARAAFHDYSLRNTLLIAQEGRRRGFTPTQVAGFKAWLKLGRSVRKGERGIAILAPVRVKERDNEGEATGESRVWFRTAYVFDTLSRESPGRAERRRRAFDREQPRRGGGCWVAGATRRVAEVAQHPAARPTAGRRGALVAPPGSAAWSAGIRGRGGRHRHCRLPNESERESAGGSGTS
jgi:N-terminal domain of anti-restriction factor ArdC